MSPGLPEQQARVEIDKALDAAGWVIQDRAELNLSAGPGVAVREFKMADGHGIADYMLFVEGKAVGVLEAKPAGYPLTRRRAAGGQIRDRPARCAQPARRPLRRRPRLTPFSETVRTLDVRLHTHILP